MAERTKFMKKNRKICFEKLTNSVKYVTGLPMEIRGHLSPKAAPMVLANVIFAMLALLPIATYAGTSSGGGGNAVVCFANHPEIVGELRADKARGGGTIPDEDIPYITSVEILDLYQAKHVRSDEDFSPAPQQIIEMKPGETASSYIDRINDRFSVLAPSTSEILGLGRQALAQKIAAPHGIRPIDDIDGSEIFDTTTCVRTTIIGQYVEGSDNFIRYDSRIFDLPEEVHSSLSKTVSLIHEYMYNFALKNGATASDATRILVGSMISANSTLPDIINETRALSESYFGGASPLSYLDVLTDQIQRDLNSVIQPTDLEKGFFEGEHSFESKCATKARELSEAVSKRYLQIDQAKVLDQADVPIDVLKKIDSSIRASLSIHSVMSDADEDFCSFVLNGLPNDDPQYLDFVVPVSN